MTSTSHTAKYKATLLRTNTKRLHKVREPRKLSADTQPHAPAFLHSLSPELRLQIWENLLVSTDTITPRYTVCYNCGYNKDIERHDVRHTSDCIWDPLLYLNLYPEVLRTCRLFYNEGVHILYTKNSFSNLCQYADATAAYFFQSIGEENAHRIQSYILRWPYITPSSALIYLSTLPNLQCLAIEGFDMHKPSKINMCWLSRIRATNIQWATVNKETKDIYSDIITGRVAKRKRRMSWANAEMKAGSYKVDR